MGFFDTIKKIFKGFKVIPERIGILGKGLKSAMSGVWFGIIRSLQSAGLAVESIGNAIWDTLKLIYKYIVCIINFFINLPYCFLAHIITLIVYVAYYLLFELPLRLLIFATGMNLRQEADELWKIIKYGDETLYQIAGFRLTEYPPEIVNRCYKCHGKIQTTQDVYDDLNEFNRIGNYMDNTFNRDIPNKMRLPKNLFRESNMYFKKLVSPI